MAGWTTLFSGIVPYFSSASEKPATVPGVPDARCEVSDFYCPPLIVRNISREALAGAISRKSIAVVFPSLVRSIKTAAAQTPRLRVLPPAHSRPPPRHLPHYRPV